MARNGLLKCGIFASTRIVFHTACFAGQAPSADSDQDVPVSHRDRVCTAEQFSYTVSVTDPVDNKLVGAIQLGDRQPGDFQPTV